MADLMRRQSSPASRVFGDIFGFDPLRLLNQPDVFGIEMRRTDNGYEIDMPVAGFRAEDISVSVEDDVLTISGQNDRRRFTRSMTLPDEVDTDRIDARVENGMLTLMLPRSPQAEPKRIAVRVGSGSTVAAASGNGGSQGSPS
jgi:HSP20 family protein